MISVSVVIATYARPGSLLRTLVSLRAQSEPAQEVIVAVWREDRATLEALAGESDLRVVEVEQNTVAAKENRGIAGAQGDVLAFIDDDAVAPPDWLARLRRHYRGGDVGGVGGRDVVLGQEDVDVRPVDRVGQVHWFGRLTGNHHKLVSGLRRVDFLKGCNMSFRRVLVQAIDPRLLGEIPYGFEIDLGLAARRGGARIVYDPDLTVDHYPSSNMLPDNPAQAMVVNHNHTYILLKHLDWPRRLAFLLYTFILGDRDSIGVVRGLLMVARSGWPFSLVGAHLAGKLRGIRSFAAWKLAEGYN